MILIPPLISALEAPIPPTPAIITTRSANTTAAILGISSFLKFLHLDFILRRHYSRILDNMQQLLYGSFHGVSTGWGFISLPK